MDLMDISNIFNTKALPDVNEGTILEDSLELQIIEDPLNQALMAAEELERQKQIDAYTKMVRESSSKTTVADKSIKTNPHAEESKKGSEASSSKEENWEKKFVLQNDRYLTVSRFKSAYRIHIRDFYKDRSGVMKPTKRGICLTLQEWQKLQLLTRNVNNVLSGFDTQ